KCNLLHPSISRGDDDELFEEALKSTNLANRGVFGGKYQMRGAGRNRQYSSAIKVISTIAEVLWDQMDGTKKSLTRSKSNCTPPFSSQTVEEIMTFLSEGSGNEDEYFVYVVVHNIDGPGLRESEMQQYLANLAACSQVRFVASIDHVNAPLC
ncbi:hypothetical protein KI387_005593, partial [Taxus chinensis]